MNLIEQDGTPCEQLQKVLASGLFSDLLHANFGLGVDRNEVRKAFRLRPIPSEEEVQLLQPTSAPTILWPVIVEDDGRTSDEIIAALEARGIEVTDYAKQIVAKANEPVPPKGTVYRFVGIEGTEFATDAKRTTKAIFAAAARSDRNYGKPSLRAGLLLREKFSQEELGHPYVAVMSEPVSGADDGPGRLGLGWVGGRGDLDAWDASPDGQWGRGGLFLFLAPQVSAQS